MKKIGLFLIILFGGLYSIGQSVQASLKDESEFTNVVIFIRFADETSYVAPYTYSHYEAMFNGVDQVSLRDYYLEASYGQLTINSILATTTPGQIVYYTDTYERAYFEPYDQNTNPTGYDEGEDVDREHGLLKRAIGYVENSQIIPDNVDLDVNNDGLIDSITFMVSGEDNGWSSLLWPHMWSLYSFSNSQAPRINGIRAYDYTFELLGNSEYYNYQVDVGVLAHETFHLIGAPDLYHYYAYDNVFPVGNWGLMEYNGRTPSHMLGYMKYQYGGWIDSVPEITESGTYTLYPMQDDPSNIYRINTGFSNEWIYLEYRDDDGFYESTLPNYGLLVYRVDLDFINIGNTEGYYDESGNTANEVFVFRPDMADMTEPYEFLDNGDYDNSGDYNNAALSQYNDYDAVGLGTDIPMFNSLGYDIDITIDNVVESNGSITFDVTMPATITLDVKGETGISDPILLDDEMMDYRVSIGNVGSNQAYYTLDGSTPDTTDTLYTGSPIHIDADHQTLKVAIYDGQTLISTLEKSYTFESTIQSSHNPYGDNVNKTWYLDFGSEQEFNLNFNPLSETEEDYDYVTVYTKNHTLEYTGDFGAVVVNDTSQYAIINFYSDYSEDGYYGFALTYELLGGPFLNLNGNDVIYHEVNTTYTDLGAYITGSSSDDYTLTTTGTVDSNLLGTYTITYTVFDALDQLVLTDTRTVYVVDTLKPVITLNGESEVAFDVGETYLELGASFTDNYDTEGEIIIGGDMVNTDVVGVYHVTYNITDSSGNIADTVTRDVYVLDTINPTVELIGESSITIEVYGTYTEFGAIVSDNYDLEPTLIINGTVNPNLVGEYVIIYQAVDSSTNFSNTVSRTVYVIDSTAPTLSLVDAELFDVEWGTSFDDPGVIYSDNYDQIIEIIVSGDHVDVMTVGTYTITYQGIDGSGNLSAIITRQVIVADTTAPEGHLNPSVDSIFIGDTYVDQGVGSSEDNLALSVDSTLNTDVVGHYLITYTLTDINGNDTFLYRYVTVLGSEEPTFELNPSIDTIVEGELYEEQGATITYDGETLDMTILESTINTELSGLYHVTYMYQVGGNLYTYTRYVQVISTTELMTETAYIKEEEVTIQ